MSSAPGYKAGPALEAQAGFGADSVGRWVLGVTPPQCCTIIDPPCEQAERARGFGVEWRRASLLEGGTFRSLLGL